MSLNNLHRDAIERGAIAAYESRRGSGVFSESQPWVKLSQWKKDEEIRAFRAGLSALYAMLERANLRT